MASAEGINGNYRPQNSIGGYPGVDLRQQATLRQDRKAEADRAYRGALQPQGTNLEKVADPLASRTQNNQPRQAPPPEDLVESGQTLDIIV